MVPCLDTGETGLYYLDIDGDGYGDSDVSGTAEEAADDWVTVAGDCDDNNAFVYPGAEELCDGTVNDCSTAEAWEWAEAESGLISHHDDGGWSNLDWSGSVAFTGQGQLWLCQSTDYTQELSVNLTVSSTNTLVITTRGETSRALPVEPVSLRSAADGLPVLTVDGGVVELTNVQLTGANNAGDGGGALLNGGTLILGGSRINGNIAGRGGGVFAAGGVLEIDSTWIEDNVADSGGGVYADGVDVFFNNSGINRNIAESGGAAYFADNIVNAMNTRVTDNEASTVAAGLLITDGAAVDFSQSVLDGNSSVCAFQGNRLVGDLFHAADIASGSFSSGGAGAGCYWDQTVTTASGGEYAPSDPFVFTCDKNGCVE